MRTRRILVRKDEQCRRAWRARCPRVHSATVNRPTGVSRGPTLCLRQRGHWKTLARSTAGSRVGHYNYFRSYSAERGRYTQADPIGLDGGFNRFGYVDGDALSKFDPKGLSASCPAPCPPDKMRNYEECVNTCNDTAMEGIAVCSKFPPSQRALCMAYFTNTRFTCLLMCNLRFPGCANQANQPSSEPPGEPPSAW